MSAVIWGLLLFMPVGFLLGAAVALVILWPERRP